MRAVDLMGHAPPFPGHHVILSADGHQRTGLLREVRVRGKEGFDLPGAGRALIALPVPVPTVLQFIVDHARRTTESGLRHELPPAIDRALVARGFKGKVGPLALATLTHRIYVLSKAHQLQKMSNACDEPGVKELLAMSKRGVRK